MKLLLLYVFIVALNTVTPEPVCDTVTGYFQKKDDAFDKMLNEIHDVILPDSTEDATPQVLYDGLVGDDTVDNGLERFNDAAQTILTGYFDACYSLPEEKASFQSQSSSYLEKFLTGLGDGVNYTETREAFGVLACLKEFSAVNTTEKKRAVSLLDLCGHTTTIFTLYDCVHSDKAKCLFDVDPETRCTDDATDQSIIPPDCMGFAIDTTGSMGAEISSAKSIALKFVESEKVRSLCYVLSAFNDYYKPLRSTANLDLYRIYDAQSATDNSGTFTVTDYNDIPQTVYGLTRLNSDINSLYAHGGGDCPEFGMIALLKSIEFISGIKYSKATVAGKHNIILLTDASAKDDSLYAEVIEKAKAANVRIHIFYSHTWGCGGGYLNYRTVAQQTKGLEVTGINDAAFTQVVDYLTAQSSDAMTIEPDEDDTLCVTFVISPFMTSFNALYITTTTTITVTKPDGTTLTRSTYGYGFSIHEEDSPMPGTWKACVSSGSLSLELKTTGDLDVDVENVVEDEEGDGGFLPTNDLPLSCHNTTFILSASKETLGNISLDYPLYLNLINEESEVVAQTEILVCGNSLFASIIMPYDDLLQYQLQGRDIYGDEFRQYLAKRLVDFEAPELKISFPDEDVFLNPGGTSIVRAIVSADRLYEGNMTVNLNYELPAEITVDYIPSAFTLTSAKPYVEFNFTLTASSDLTVDTNQTTSFTLNSSCTPDKVTEVKAQIKQGVNLFIISKKYNEIVFGWTAPIFGDGSVATSYILYINIDGVISEYTVVSNSYTLTGLKPYQEVFVRIVVITNTPGVIAAIAPLSFRSAESEPSAVRNMRTLRVNSTTILVVWERPEFVNGILLNYRVDIGNKSYTTYNTELYIYNLAPYVQYEVTAYAENSAGMGSMTSRIFYSEEGTPTIPPLNITYTFPSSTSILVKWVPIPLHERRGFLTNYIIVIKEYGNDNIRTILVSATRTEYLITGISEFANVTLAVAAKTTAGEGPPFGINRILIVIGIPSAPVEFTGNLTTNVNNSVIFQWKEPIQRNGSILAYYLWHKTATSEKTIMVTDYEKTNGTYMMEYTDPSLQEFDSQHNFTIVAVNDAGWGVKSEQVQINIPSDVTGSSLPLGTLAPSVGIPVLLVILIVIIAIIIIAVVIRQKKGKTDKKYDVDDDDEMGHKDTDGIIKKNQSVNPIFADNTNDYDFDDQPVLYDNVCY